MITIFNLIGGFGRGSAPPVDPSPAELFFEGNWLVYIPPGYHDAANASRDYPVIMNYAGTGTFGSTQTVTAQAISSGSAPNYSGTFVNTGNGDVLHTSVVFKNNGVAFAHVYEGDIIRDSDGADIGSANVFSASGAFSFTESGLGTVTVDYDWSLNLFEGYGLTLNEGDQPQDVPGDNFKMAAIVVCVQIPSGSFAIVDDWDEPIDWLVNNYRVNTNRLYHSGLSNGAFLSRLLAIDRYDEDLAAMPTPEYAMAGTVSVSGWSSSTAGTYTDLQDMGIMHIWGASDATVSSANARSIASAAHVNDLRNPHNFRIYYGYGHESAVWQTRCFNRLERTDAVGTADFDFIRFLLKYSTDTDEQATLHVEQAEDSEDTIDYFKAVRRVSFMSGGSVKTALEARLAAVRTAIVGSGYFVIMDFGLSTYTSSGNINNYSKAAFTAQTGSLSDLIDDTGANTGIDFAIINVFGNQLYQDNKSNAAWYGLPREFSTDGLRMQSGVTNGQYELQQLPDAEFDLITMHTSIETNFTDNRKLSVTINSTTKEEYSELNSERPIVFTGLTRDGSNKIIVDADYVVSQVIMTGFVLVVKL